MYAFGEKKSLKKRKKKGFLHHVKKYVLTTYNLKIYAALQYLNISIYNI